MKTNWLILFSLLLVLNACNSDEEINVLEDSRGVQDTVEDTRAALSLPLSDCWTEIEDEAVLQFSGSNHNFCFLNDSEFTLEIKSWSDILSDNLPSERIEYIKGAYILTNETFEISGIYMDSDFQNATTGIFGDSEFEKAFDVKVISETEFILDNNDMFPYRAIRLLK